MNNQTKMSSIPIFPKLYKINSNKKISEWEIQIVKNNSIYTVITSHGEKDGKKISHEKDIEEGKGKRSILEQAIQDANRKWENKKEKELYSEIIPNLNSVPKISSIVVRPMLAQTFDFDIYQKKSRAFKIPFPAYIQRKYDGIRCIAYLKNDEVILESRKGISFQNFKTLKSQLRDLYDHVSSNFYFDGELYTEKLDFEVVSGLIRLHEDKITKEELQLIDKIEYHVYDFVEIDKLSLSFDQRYQILSSIFKKNVNKSWKIKPVETIMVHNLEDIKKYHDEFVSDGYEGLMVRDKDGPYEINKRSKYLQKFKEFQEEEFKIVGFHEGTGDEKGAIIWDCITKDNKTFAVRPKGTFESRQYFYEHGDQYIGKLLTVIFQEYSNDGIPRFPVGKGIRDIY